MPDNGYSLPLGILQAAGIPNNPIILYGNKIFKKAQKHIYKPADLKDLPNAINNPIAVLKGNRADSFVILTELNVNGNNVLVAVETNKKGITDFTFITSVYDKSGTGVLNWMNTDKALRFDKEKSLNYLSALAKTTSATNNSETSSSDSLRISAPIAEAQDNQKSFHLEVQMLVINHDP